MSAQSDRIRAVLSRSESTRTSSEPSSVNSQEKTGTAPSVPAPAVETTLPLIAAGDQLRAAYPLPLVPGAPQKRNYLRLTALVVGAVVVIAGVAAILTLNRWWPHRQEPSTVNLQMQVESQGRGLITIRWNPRSTSVLQAREGRLVTTEPGQQPRTVALDIAQLKAGHVYYQSQAQSLEFRLEVVDRSGGVTAESVMASSPGAPAAPVATTSPVVPPVQAAASRGPSVNPAPPPAAPPPAAPLPDPVRIAQATPPPSRPSVRQFTPPVSQPVPEQKSAILLDAPAAVSGAAAIGAPIGMPPGVRDLGVPQVKAVAPTENPAAATKQLKVGGALQPGSLIKKVNPVYPEVLKMSHIQGTVRFTATIGKDGKIRDLQLVSGNPVLVQPARDAVKQWQYRPTTLDGEPVEVITQIDVEFALNR